MNVHINIHVHSKGAVLWEGIMNSLYFFYIFFSGKLQGYYIHKELFLGDEGQAVLCSLLGVQAAEEMYEKQVRYCMLLLTGSRV